MGLNQRNKRVWTRGEVAEGILAGDNLVIFRDQVLKVPPSWLQSHPGGALAILHYVGRDATNEIEAYHAEAALKMVARYSAGTIDVSLDEGWAPFIPPFASGWVRQVDAKSQQLQWARVADIEAPPVPKTNEKNTLQFTSLNYAPSEILLVEKADLATSETAAKPQGPTLATITPPASSLSLSTQARHARAFRQLHKKIEDAGLYNTRYLAGYGPEVARYLTLALISATTYRHGWYLTSALFLGLLWHQLTFIVHDLGHMGVTHNWTLDRMLGISIAAYIGGLSITWWVDNHNIHHLVTNHPTHDPDIQHIPFFAISPAFLNSLYSSYYNRVMTFDGPSKVLLALQHRLYYFVMSLARFNLYGNSYGYLYKLGVIRGKRGPLFWFDIVGIAFFWVWYSYLISGVGGGWKGKLGYILISHIAASPVHVQIVLSHFSRSTADLGPTESFVDRQLRTTSDVICSPAIEFIHGGLHLQVTHHLFPRLPRHNLRAASLLVKEFAREHELEYAEFRFTEGNQEVLDVLRSVADQVKFIAKVADHEAKERGRVVRS
ncbi:delta 8-sphingolipid desaturase [Clavulina sp. PMI_390]|nr:delta 8-sphingolipid desaturase [Clavulina sp. PMI_390]